MQRALGLREGAGRQRAAAQDGDNRGQKQGENRADGHDRRFYSVFAKPRPQWWFRRAAAMTAAAGCIKSLFGKSPDTSRPFPDAAQRETVRC
ncbi:MAG: hypothetical protein NTAFB05_30860 [Nitrobacter sp.]